MKRLNGLLLLAALGALLITPSAFAATASAATGGRSDRSPAALIANAVSTVTGIAISPLLGTSAYGAYQWFAVKGDAARAALPWYAQLKFWLPALLIVGACAAKDALGTVLPPGIKKPFDVLEATENKVSGLVAAGAVVPFAVDTFSKVLFGGKTAAGAVVLGFSGVASIHLAALNLAPLLDVLTIPFGIAMFAIVWMAAHAINVLILLSPWGAIDAALKGARTALLGLLTLTATINPWVGALLALVIIVVAYFVAGWAFRLTVFGSVFCWDFVTRRRRRFVPAENDNAMFAGPDFPGVPVRTYGRLVQRTRGPLEFVYHPWLKLPVRVARVPVDRKDLAVGAGMFFSDIEAGGGRTLFSLPPRYRGHEDVVARAYGIGSGVRAASLRKAWSALREMLGGRALQAPVAG